MSGAEEKAIVYHRFEEDIALCRAFDLAAVFVFLGDGRGDRVA